jgi:thioredoxin-like negative regulator of GroEL
MNESEYTSPDGDYDLLEQFGIRNVPTIIIADDSGKVMDKFVGVVTTSKLKELIELWDLECI